jgi:hypothetical protein
MRRLATPHGLQYLYIARMLGGMAKFVLGADIRRRN